MLGFGCDSDFGLGVAVQPRNGAEPGSGSSLTIHWGTFFVDPELQLIGVGYDGVSADSFRHGVHAALP